MPGPCTLVLKLEDVAMSTDVKQAVVIDYTNWKGSRRWRYILPKGLAYRSDQWHPQAQWMIEAVDLQDKDHKGTKFFPLADIHKWTSDDEVLWK